MTEQIVIHCGRGALDTQLYNDMKSGLSLTSTTTELNLTDGMTSSTAELNTLDAFTGTTTNMNSVSGQTKVEEFFPFAKQNMSSNETYLLGSTTFANVAGLAEVDGYVMPRAGSITSMAFRMGAVLGAVSRTVAVAPYKVTAAGTSTALNGTITISSTSGVQSTTAYTIATKAFLSGDRIGLKVVTGSANAGTEDFHGFLGIVT